MFEFRSVGFFWLLILSGIAIISLVFLITFPYFHCRCTQEYFSHLGFAEEVSEKCSQFVLVTKYRSQCRHGWACRIRSHRNWVPGRNHSLMNCGRHWGSDFIIPCSQHEAIRKKSGEKKANLYISPSQLEFWLDACARCPDRQAHENTQNWAAGWNCNVTQSRVDAWPETALFLP